MALDRNEATRAKPVKGEEVVGKKNLQLSHPSINKLHIERLLFTSKMIIARKSSIIAWI
jgi:hypothetical protein